MQKSSTYLSLFLLLGLLLVPGCDDTGTVSYDPVSGSEISVDPIFREFYDSKGGLEVLGPAISPLFTYNGISYQYTVNSLMVFDPQAAPYLRRAFAPLALDMGVEEPAVQAQDRPGSRYVNGHFIDERFVAVYDALGGQPVVGRPITEAHYNPDYRRYEQYFENLGLFISDVDPDAKVRLLAYGVWKCDASCRQYIPGNAYVSIPFRTDALFADAVSRLGADFTGYALTEAYLTPDGYTEQVFENLVLVHDPNQPGRVFLRPITEHLGILPESLVPPNGLPDHYFYPVQDNTRGHNIPKQYLDYIALHGGQEVFGPPISENTLRKDNVYRQCFVNLCLEERVDGKGNRQVSPAQLGFNYRSLALRPVFTPQSPSQPMEAAPIQPTPAYTEPTAVAPTQEAIVQPSTPTPIPTTPPPAPADSGIGGQPAPGEIVLQVWESLPMVAPSQNQEIGVIVLMNNLPLRNIEPDLLVQHPDGSVKRYFMYPTGEDGLTRMVIDAIDAPAGTVIPYQVCVFPQGGQKYCVQDSFLIWMNP